MAKTYLNIHYAVEATIGIRFEYDTEKWNALTKEQQDKVFLDGIGNADAVLGNCLDGSDGGDPAFSIDGYIPDRKDFDHSTIEIEEEELWEDERGGTVEGRVNE